MLYLLLLVTVLVTSVLSGILGMAGGMLLMAVLVFTLPVAGAMIFHGAVQMLANGSRAWFLREHIQWQILPPYLLGAGVVLALLSLFAFVPEPGLVLIAIGALPWLALVFKSINRMHVGDRASAFVCGIVVTTAQLLAGVSGPLLDMFYVNAPLNRHQIIASKGLTQALGHLMKIGYYGALLVWGMSNVETAEAFGDTQLLPLWMFAAGMLMAIAGTRIGTWILERWNEAAFRSVSQKVILAIATLCLAQGVYALL